MQAQGCPGATRGWEQGLEQVLPSRSSTGTHADSTFTLDFEPPAFWETKFLLFKPLSLEIQYSYQQKSVSLTVVQPPRGIVTENVSSQQSRLQRTPNT